MIQRLLLSLPLSFSRTLGRLFPSFGPRERKTLVIVLFQNSEGWILERICRDLARVAKDQFGFSEVIWHNHPNRVPRGDVYFFAHHSFQLCCLKLNPFLWSKEMRVFFTHMRDDLGQSTSELFQALSAAQVVITNSSIWTHFLVENGISPNIARTFPAGAEEADFPEVPADTPRRGIGFCSAYYPRKNPDLLLAIAKAFPNQPIELLGKGWEKSPVFDQLKSLPNFQYLQHDYREYPSIFSRWKCYVQTSKTEGGCVPTFETMLCDVIPVASRTGSAPDIIDHGKNGFLFDTDSSPEHVISLVNIALKSNFKPRATVLKYSWSAFSRATLE